MDRFSALKAFTRVVEAGSFTRAADSLNMPNATLSKTIQQLEAHLGVSPAAHHAAYYRDAGRTGIL
jgi:DNA-binding transcriptional LysR family regulator